MFRYTILAENRAFSSAENRACGGATNGDGSAKARRRRRARRRERREPTAPRKTGGNDGSRRRRARPAGATGARGAAQDRRAVNVYRLCGLASGDEGGRRRGKLLPLRRVMLPQMLENTPVKAQPLRRVNVRLLWCVMLRLERKSAVGGRRESGGRAGRAAASPDGKPSRWG